MKGLVVVLKLLGSAAIAFAGYFVMAAVGWPEPLDSMALERGFVGGALMLLGGLCAAAIFVPDRPKSRKAATAPSVEPAPEPAPEAAPYRPFRAEDQEAAKPEPDPEPAPEATVAAAPEPEPEAEPEPEPGPELELEPEPEAAPVETPAVSPHPAGLASIKTLLDKGDALFSEGRIDDALEPYGDALDAARGLHAAAPTADTEDLLAASLKAVGDAYDETGRLDPATDVLDEALAIRKAQLARAPEDPVRKRAVSLVLERLGDVREARGHTVRALDLYRSSLPLAEALAAADPDNPVYREDLIATRRRIDELESQLAAPLV